LAEVPLAKRFEVSRGTMREAPQDLREPGLVEHINRGAAVATVAAAGVAACALCWSRGRPRRIAQF
jgi:DNA-binding GntR family transcriptional regulator